jgi:predicted RNA-binding Zn-ribbon protein involved in translation (DUF1610 family)
VEACPPELIWEFVDEAEDGSTKTIQIDSRKVPQGITQEGFLSLVSAGVLDYTVFILPAEDPIGMKAEEVAEKVLNSSNVINDKGELNLGTDAATMEAIEYETDDKQKAIKCLSCHKEITYVRLANGGTKKCPFCGNVNRVTKV